MEIIEKVETFFRKIKKIFHWIPFLWKLDDGSYESLYKVNIEQMIDIQKEIEKFVDVYQEGFSYCLQMEEVKKNLFLAMQEPIIETDYSWFRPSISTIEDKSGFQGEASRKYDKNKQESLEWWI